MKFLKKITVSACALAMIMSTQSRCVDIKTQLSDAQKKVFKWVSAHPIEAAQAAIAGIATTLAVKKAYQGRGFRGGLERLAGQKAGALGSIDTKPSSGQLPSQPPSYESLFPPSYEEVMGMPPAYVPSSAVEPAG